MASLFQQSVIQYRGAMLDDTINMGMGPLHCFPPPSSVLEPDDAGYAPSHERPICDANGSPFKWRDVEGRRVPARAPAAVSQASLLPTADDYANLSFCESSKEEEAGAGLLAAAGPSSDDAAPRRTTAAATATSATMTSTKHNKRKQRRVSFGASSMLHLLADTPPCSAMTADERSLLWLSRSDLEALKSSAQRSIQEVRDRVRGGHNGGAAVVRRRSEFRALMVAMEDETGSSVRGLEQRVFRRKWTRRDVIRDVLECQSHAAGLARLGRAMDGEESARLLARASRDRSLKARIVAYVDAKDDRREVYGRDDTAGGDGVNMQRTLKRRKRPSGGTRKVRRGGHDNDVPPAFIHFARTKM